MNREAVDKWCERLILGLTLALMTLLPLVFGGRPQPATGRWFDFILLEPFLIAQCLMVPLLGVWLVRLWLAPKIRLLWPPVCWAVLAFAVYAVVVYFLADVEYVARQEMLRVVLYAFVFFAVINNLHRQESTQIISFTMIFLAMAIASYAIYQYLVDSNRVWHVLKPYSGRASGTYISPNHLAGLLELALPLGLAYTVMGRLKLLFKVFLGYASLVMVAGIATTQSRGAWIAIALALIFMFAALFLNGTYRLPSLLFLLLLFSAVFLFAPRNISAERRLKQLLQPKQAENDTRFMLWKPALLIWGESPWVGVGPAHFDVRFRQFRPEDVQRRPDRAHNDYLNTLADWGVIGTTIIASAWLLLGIGAWKTWRFVRRTPGDLGGKRTSNKFAFVLGSTTALVAILAHSVVDFNMHVPANAVFTVVLMALLASHSRFATERYWLTPGIPLKILTTLALCAGIGLISALAVRRVPENLALARAAVSPVFSPQQAAHLERAFAVEPKNPETAFGLGEALRIQSSEGAENYVELGEQALAWFEKAANLNPWNSDHYARAGAVLDWLDRSAESTAKFARAEELDPNGYFTMAFIGYHYVNTGNYAAAKPYFERSIRLEFEDNPMAKNYLQITKQRMLEAAGAQVLPSGPRP